MKYKNGEYYEGNWQNNLKYDVGKIIKIMKISFMEIG